MPTKTRVIIVDDHPLVRVGMRQVLAVPDIEVVAEAASGADALRLLATLECDVVVLDISMPGRHGVEVLRRVTSEHPDQAVLIYTRFPEDQYAVRAIRAGAAGYVMKGADPAELLSAVRRIARGEQHVSPAVSHLLSLQPPSGHTELSEREFEILRFIVAGRSVSAIAADLSLSVKTVSTHRVRILRKLGLGSTADLVHYAIEHGLQDGAS
jgi:two-component system invasion response regulator UvrY